jgi:hypothetical protein
VNIQDDFCSEESGDYGTEDQKIRHVVNVNDTVSPRGEKAASLYETPKKELHVLNEVAKPCTTPMLGLIQPEQSHTPN